MMTNNVKECSKCRTRTLGDTFTACQVCHPVLYAAEVRASGKPYLVVVPAASWGSRLDALTELRNK